MTGSTCYLIFKSVQIPRVDGSRYELPPCVATYLKLKGAGGPGPVTGCWHPFLSIVLGTALWRKTVESLV